MLEPALQFLVQGLADCLLRYFIAHIYCCAFQPLGFVGLQIEYPSVRRVNDAVEAGLQALFL